MTRSGNRLFHGEPERRPGDRRDIYASSSRRVARSAGQSPAGAASSGWTSILLGRRLVMVVEMRDGLDYRTAFASHASSSQRVAEWEHLMKSLQEPAGRGAGGRMVGRHGAGFSSRAGERRSRPLPTSPIGRARPESGAMTHLRQAWAVPSRPRPIVIIGAGGVVRTAHLPVYQRLKFPVAGIYDVKQTPRAKPRGASACRPCFPRSPRPPPRADAIFDVAVPGDQIAGVLKELPRGSAVLIQKPMGEDLAAARSIVDICRERRSRRGDEFSASLQPERAGASRSRGQPAQLGEIVDIEVRLVVKQPWHLWKFLEQAPRLEILYHSIHYLDTIRALAGEPRGVYCRAVAHPSMPEFQDTRSTIILDYGNALRCSLLLNHTHQQKRTHGASFLKVEGTTGRRAADARRQHRLSERARATRSKWRSGKAAGSRSS